MTCCQRCKQTHSGPQAFLLTCLGCSKSWHHRCHMPLVEDDDLIRLIRATNAGDTANGLSSWMCRRCKKGASATPSTMSSREQTASREDSKGVMSSHLATAPTANVVSTPGVRVKQESGSITDARPAIDRERDGRESTESAPVVSVKRTKPSGANQPEPGSRWSRDGDVQMRDATPIRLTLPEKKRPTSPARSLQVKAARKFGGMFSATPTEDDVEMQIDSSTSSGSASRASKAPSKSAAEVSLPSSLNEREQGLEVRPADIQPQVNQQAFDEEDDSEDLYGPPVERRIIRILPSLAEELREQQRRVAAEKEKRRAPLVPDWIYAKHANDPLWRDIPTQGRKRRKGTARKLGENGVNVKELMDYYTTQNRV